MDRYTVVFMPLVSTSQHFRDILNRKGFKAGEVNGQSKEDVINQWPAEVRNEIRNAVCDIKVDPPKNSQAASGAQEEPKKTLLDKLFGN